MVTDNNQAAAPVRVFIAGGINTHRVHSLKAEPLSGTMICGIHAHRKHLQGMRPGDNPYPTWFYDDLCTGSDYVPGTPLHVHYARCLDFIMSDPRTHYLAERTYGVGGQGSVFNYSIRFEIACWKSLAILNESRPDRLVYMAITHHPMTWVFGRCAECLGIPTYMTSPTPLPWRYWPVKGIDDQAVVDVAAVKSSEASGDVPSQRTLDFVELNNKSYENAIPDYLHRNRGSQSPASWSWKDEVKQLAVFSPVLFVKNMARLRSKMKLYSLYNRLAKPVGIQKGENYVVFFLHYQPEATSLPMGLGYVQQWYAIRAISAALPKGWKIVVKEHFAIYRFAIMESVRCVEFYEAIAALPQAVIAPFDASPFDLIDGSAAVATLTGTVGIQALCRGRPVLAFGAAAFRNCPGVFAVQSIEQTRQALDTIRQGRGLPSRENLLKYLAWVESKSVSGLKDDDTQSLYNGETRRQNKSVLWKSLIVDAQEPSVQEYMAVGL